MGGTQSAEAITNGLSLSDLLEAPTVDWALVDVVLHEQPEQAALYAQSIETSPLQRALTRSPPPHVVRLFIAAYEDALYHFDSTGQSVLHACVNGTEDCAAVLQLLLEYCTTADLCEAGLYESKQTPLHSNLRDAQAARMLIQACPDGLRTRCAFGLTPLHCAMQPGSSSETLCAPKVVRVLAEEAKALGIPDCGLHVRTKRGQTPMDLLCVKLDGEFGVDGEPTEHGRELWDLLLHLLRLLSDAPKEDFLEVHAVLEATFLTNICHYALKLFSNQLSQRDCRGRTPLHIAASLPRVPSVLIRELAALHPSAARMGDSESRVPIDLAAENGIKDTNGLLSLIEAEPRAVDTRDLRDGYYPFFSAALGADETVNSTYTLLRAVPHVLSYFQHKK